MKLNIKVSVAIITYNAERYISEVLESVLSQKCNFEFEVIVGDDASEDGTIEILNKYALDNQGIITTIFHEKNVGANQNYLDVLNACNGEYIAHLDGDDLMIKNKLQIQSDYLDCHTNISACFHNMRVFEDETNRFIRWYNDCNRSEFMTLSEAVRNGVGMCHSAKMFRRNTVTDIDLTLPTVIVFDWLMHLYHARKGDLAYINQVLGEYRNSSKSVVFSNVDKIEQVRQDFLLTIDIAESFGVNQSDVKYGRARINFERAMRALEQKKYNIFIKLIEESANDSIYISFSHKAIYKLKNLGYFLYKFHLLRSKFNQLVEKKKI
jgi:glycosyltransferase involved in cell wall biosynthesis